MTIKRKIKSDKITIDHLEEFKGKDVIITIEEFDHYSDQQKEAIIDSLENSESEIKSGKIYDEREVGKIIESWLWM